MPDPEAERIAAEFLMELLVDREQGRVVPLAAYLARYPRHEAVVAREFLAQATADATSADPMTPGAAPAGHLGPYRLLRELGSGGQGVVYLALDVRLNRHVALKVLTRASGLAHHDALRRFQREAEIAARLDHPGICAVHDVGADRGRVYIAMRYVEGASLSTLIARARQEAATAGDAAPLVRALGSSDAPSIARVLELVERIARALHVAHEAGVIHRDVKPGNVIVTPEGDPVVLDFGLARPREDQAAPVTMTGDVLGTPAYMSPEQISGVSSGLDRRTDVWALGVVLFECLTLRRPFEAPAESSLADAVRVAPIPRAGASNAGVSRDLEIVIATALERDVRRRYATALDLAEELRRVRVHEPIRARPAGLGVRLWSFVRRNPVVAGLILLAFLILGAGLVTAVLLLGRVETERDAKASALASVLRLSDSARMRALCDREAALWPIGSGIVSSCGAWLADARAIRDNRAEHVRALADVRSRATPRDKAATRPFEERFAYLRRIADGAASPRQGAIPTWSERIDARREIAALEARAAFEWPDDGTGWVGELLSGLVAAYDDFEVLARDVADRQARSASLARRTIDDHASTWTDAIARIAASERYRGLRLPPQEGLVPLHADRASQLWEFHVLETGERPVWDDDREAWRIGPESGVVLVLIPAGESVMGSSLHGENADTLRLAQQNEVPIVHVPLEAHFISKYEMTQGQWERLSRGANPSFFRTETHAWATPAHPVESVSFDACTEILRRVGLTLPTEAQWERACRAGTSTPWSSGPKPSDLQGFANIADAGKGWDVFEHGVDDGWRYHAPVGSFQPNALGLHDMHGNVWEWCRDVFEPTYLSPPAGGDGLRSPVDLGLRPVRGGAFNRPGAYCRSAKRSAVERSGAEQDLGARPARAVAAR